MKRKYLAGLLVAALGVSLLAGCGGSDSASTENQPDVSTVVSPDEAHERDEAGADVDTSAEEDSEAQPVEDEPVDIPEITTDLPLQDLEVVYMVGDTCYELYNYVDGTASDYAEEINYLATELDGVANVYDVIIPTSMGITFPDNLQGETSCSNMKESMDKIIGMIESPVKVVNPYNTLMQHRDEYIYFRTDHHWTGRGAYYTYAKFCEVAGLEAADLSEYTVREYDGFLGSFFNDANKPDNLRNNPDTVEAYVPMTYDSAKMTVTDAKDQTFDWPLLCDQSTAPAGNKYGTFIAGDNPFTVIENSAITDGSSCVVIKESFGNAFVPYLIDNYQTVYVIDYRYWSGNLINFVKEKGIKDVICCNNISMIRNKSLVGKLAGILF